MFFCGVIPGSLSKVKSQIQVNWGAIEMALGALYSLIKTMCTGEVQMLALAQYLTALGAGTKKVGFELLELHTKS